MSLKEILGTVIGAANLVARYAAGTPSVAAGIPGTLLDDRDWAAAMAKPDVSGSYPYAAPDVSAEWPGAWDKNQTWSLSIAIKAHIPWLGDDGGNMTTGTTLALSPPDDLLRTSKDGSFKYVQRRNGWAFCSYFLGTFDAGGIFDPTCKTALSRDNSTCFTDLSQALQSAMEADGFSCPSAERVLPTTCRGLFANENNTITLEGTPEYLNGSTIFKYANESHAPGNHTAFDAARHNAWAVLTGWMHVDEKFARPSTPIVSLGCARVPLTEQEEEAKEEQTNKPTNLAGKPGISNAGFISTALALAYCLA